MKKLKFRIKIINNKVLLIEETIKDFELITFTGNQVESFMKTFCLTYIFTRKVETNMKIDLYRKLKLKKNSLTKIDGCFLKKDLLKISNDFFRTCRKNCYEENQKLKLNQNLKPNANTMKLKQFDIEALNKFIES